MISNVAGESPVVNAVFEQVSQWHRGVREAMDEDGLQKSLRIMDGPASGGDAKKRKKIVCI